VLDLTAIPAIPSDPARNRPSDPKRSQADPKPIPSDPRCDPRPIPSPLPFQGSGGLWDRLGSEPDPRGSQGGHGRGGRLAGRVRRAGGYSPPRRRPVGGPWRPASVSGTVTGRGDQRPPVLPKSSAFRLGPWRGPDRVGQSRDAYAYGACALSQLPDRVLPLPGAPEASGTDLGRFVCRSPKAIGECAIARNRNGMRKGDSVAPYFLDTRNIAESLHNGLSRRVVRYHLSPT
jgi:hypothetical protein